MSDRYTPAINAKRHTQEQWAEIAQRHGASAILMFQAVDQTSALLPGNGLTAGWHTEWSNTPGNEPGSVGAAMQMLLPLQASAIEIADQFKTACCLGGEYLPSTYAQSIKDEMNSQGWTGEAAKALKPVGYIGKLVVELMMDGAKPGDVGHAANELLLCMLPAPVVDNVTDVVDQVQSTQPKVVKTVI